MFDFLAPIFNLIIYNPMLNALLLIYRFIPNYGFAIILFTLAIAGLTMPLRIKSQQSMRATQERQAKLKPKLDELKKKYKDDKQAYQNAQMKLYQEEGLVNPFNAGCLLTLLPFPIFIGLYSVITSVMGVTPEQVMQLPSHLYPFFRDVAALIPVNPDFFGINLAEPPNSQGPIVTVLMVGLVVGVQFVQQKMMTLPTATLDSQQAQMNQQMQLIMPIFFGWIVLGTPAGLSLYWISFGLITIVQQALTSGWGSLATIRLPFGSNKTQTIAKPKKPIASPASGLQSGNGSDDTEMQNKTAVGSGNGYSGSRKGKKKSGKKR